MVRRPPALTRIDNLLPTRPLFQFLLAQPGCSLAQVDAHARALSEQVFDGLAGHASPERLQVLGDHLSAVIPWPVLYWPQHTQPLAQNSMAMLLRLSATSAPRRADRKSTRLKSSH